MKQKVHISLHPTIYKRSKQYAKDVQRSLSEVVERLLEREITRVDLIQDEPGNYSVDKKSGVK
jgi:predicted CopG family antitoxin